MRRRAVRLMGIDCISLKISSARTRVFVCVCVLLGVFTSLHAHQKNAPCMHASFRVTSVCVGSRCVRIPVPSSCSSSSTGEAAENTKTFLCSSRLPPPPDPKKSNSSCFFWFIPQTPQQQLPHTPTTLHPCAAGCLSLRFVSMATGVNLALVQRTLAVACVCVRGRLWQSAHTDSRNAHFVTEEQEWLSIFISRLRQTWFSACFFASVYPSVCLYVRLAILRVTIINIFFMTTMSTAM